MLNQTKPFVHKVAIRKSSEDRKAEIVRIALELSFKLGPEQVTTSIIARNLGLSQPAIYKHFPKKADIWLAISESLGERMKNNIGLAHMCESTGIDQLRHLFKLHLELMRDVPALPDIMVMRTPDGGKSRMQSHLQTSMATYRKALIDTTRKTIESGYFRQDLDPEDAATLIVGIAQSLALRMLVSRDPDILVSNGQRLLDILLSGFTQKGET